MHFLFDMDGVLVNSEPASLKAAAQVLARRGVAAQECDFYPFIGAGEEKLISGVCDKYGIRYESAMAKEAFSIFCELAPQELYVYPNTVSTLQKLFDGGARLAVASSASHAKIFANLQNGGIDPKLFTAILGREDVTRLKPDGEIYELAAKAVDADKSDCLVVEDAINGIKAAKNAGIRCVGITTSFSKQQLLDAGADEVISDISQLLSCL